VVTHDALSKLPLYQGLRIPEVWLWRNDDLEVHCLEPDGYRRAGRSRLLPGLHLALLATHARMPTSTMRYRRFAARSVSRG
jgi:hypothetical protein